MRITITKGEREDRIDARRADGTTVRTQFPHKGPVPHDAVHFFVETRLGIGEGFWGLVARGHHPEAIGALAKQAGHASAKRASEPDPAIVPIVQAERAVECFEADLWSGSAGDPATLRDVVAAGCAQSFVPALQVSDDVIAAIRADLLDLRQRWASARQGQSIELHWEGPQG